MSAECSDSLKSCVQVDVQHNLLAIDDWTKAHRPYDIFWKDIWAGAWKERDQIPKDVQKLGTEI